MIHLAAFHQCKQSQYHT